MQLKQLAILRYLEDDEVDVQKMGREFGKVNSSIPVHIAKNGIDALDKLLGTHQITNSHVFSFSPFCAIMQ